MKNLSDEDSWKLFSFYAFRDRKENRAPSHLIEMGREIVKQCGNLALALKTTAASLASNTDLRKWETKHRQLEKAVIPIGEHDPVMDILKLSYDSLPAHLKACFAYFSFFPEDENINCEFLVNLWIGEGFIPAGEEQWDMAWDWLDQLVQLCLLQPWENKEYNLNDEERLIKYCSIHDLLHDLSIHISRENECIFSVEEVSTHTSGVSGWCRILLAKKDVNDNAISSISHSCPVYLCTFSLSQNMEITSIPANLFTAMRGLRILDLSSTSISTLPASIGKMILLKVLNLRRTKIKEVPECLRHLKSLLFLGIHWNCKSIPAWISELKCLQHLECERVDCMPKGISKLASLRTLRSRWLDLSIKEDEFMTLEDFANMTQLQELWLNINHEIELKKMEEGVLVQLTKMRHLSISLKLQSNFPSFPNFQRK
ncbi:putative disease resistance protein RGA3 isoform X1 [Cryptomeria japonica]|uniref:putative disease resistance protein RGA3 isoform X1 n=1 Tax=Cryptomeria japonica TaxID=3369 RepID=UPI0027DA901B|nr:putative disease resistance protein RGA3 isoform X1 [Cryptomeria japonica]